MATNRNTLFSNFLLFNRTFNYESRLCNACGLHYAKVVKKEENAFANYKPKEIKLSMLINESH